MTKLTRFALIVWGLVFIIPAHAGESVLTCDHPCATSNQVAQVWQGTGELSLGEETIDPSAGNGSIVWEKMLCTHANWTRALQIALEEQMFVAGEGITVGELGGFGDYACIGWCCNADPCNQMPRCFNEEGCLKQKKDNAATAYDSFLKTRARAKEHAKELEFARRVLRECGT